MLNNMNSIATSSSPAVEAISKNTGKITKVMSFLLPLFIIFYYMYSSNSKNITLVSGVLITFLIGLVLFLCNCSENRSMNTMVIVGALLAYSVVAMLVSINIKKLSKFKYILINSIVQYSLFLNLFLIILSRRN